MTDPLEITDFIAITFGLNVQAASAVAQVIRAVQQAQAEARQERAGRCEAERQADDLRARTFILEAS